MGHFRRPIGSGSSNDGKPTGAVENKKLPAARVGGRELSSYSARTLARQVEDAHAL